MNPQDFRREDAPGRLEPTTFRERNLGPSEPCYTEAEGLAYVPEPLPAGLEKDALIVAVYDHLMEAERNLSLLEGMARRIQNPGLLIGPFARKEARHSSAIENTYASEQQLALFGVDESTVDASQRPEVLEVRNYLDALHHGYVDKRPICLNLLKEMHGILLKGATRVAGIPGQFRTTQNAIGNSSLPFKDAKFVPPPPRLLSECLRDLESYIHSTELPRLVRFALVHYQFECIHPFDDGNGRLGRLLVALQLCKQGQLGLPLVYVSGFLESNRETYYDLLYRVSAEGAWYEWIRFFLTAVSTQARDALLRADRLDNLRTDFYQRVQQKRASAMLPRVIDELFSSPALTIARVAEIAQMRAPSAGNLMKKLEDAKIVKEVTGRKHYRVFVAEEIFSVMSEKIELEQ